MKLVLAFVILGLAVVGAATILICALRIGRGR